MEKLFIQILHMSLPAGFAVGFVLLARWVFIWLRVPRKYTCILWIIPFLRFCCPFSIQSIFSLLPKKSMILQRAVLERIIEEPIGQEPIRAFGFRQLDTMLFGPASEQYVDLSQLLVHIGSYIWAAGIFVLLLYNIYVWSLLIWKLRIHICLKDNVYLADQIHMPFVLGWIRPKIYIPSYIEGKELEYVLAHEQMHIRRRDSLYKIIAFVITVVYWFHPLAWVAFLCLENDMEMSCDEAVMEKLGADSCSGYAQTLLQLSTGERSVGRIPLAFGKGNIKGRVANIMSYKKPRIITGIFALAVTGALVIGLLTNPEAADSKETYEETSQLTSSKQAEEKTTQYLPEEEITEVEIVAPQITSDMPLGADDAILDYAENGLLIFHGYFGLYVYSMEIEGMVPLNKKTDSDKDSQRESQYAPKGIVGAVDLKAIGCDNTQGDEYCEVRVAEDGSKVYLHPNGKEIMYVYDVFQHKLTKRSYSLEGIELYEPCYIDRGEIEREGMCSPYGIKFGSGEDVYYGYLISKDGTVLSLKYLEGDMVVPLFLTPATGGMVPVERS